MASKYRRRSHKERNLPIPLVLFSSYIAAKKSDELIKEFCKELPGILQNINNSKKALENKTRTVCTLKEDIMQDLNKLELAKIVLKDLYQEEESFKVDKEKKLQELHSNIISNQDSKKILNNYLTKYSVSQKELDIVANQSRQYKDARHLIHTYLTLQAMNEKFIEEECNCAYRFEGYEKQNFEIQKLVMTRLRKIRESNILAKVRPSDVMHLIKAYQNIVLNATGHREWQKHKYDTLLKEEKLQSLQTKLQILQNINLSICESANDISESRKNELLKNLQIKRWVQDVCQKINNYKETLIRTENFHKLLREVKEDSKSNIKLAVNLYYTHICIKEIQEFIKFATEIIIRLEATNKY